MEENDVVIEGEIVENTWFISAINGNLEEIKKLKDNAGKKDDSGCTALMYCANLGHVDCVKYIAKTLQVELKVQDKNGNTALMYAAMTGQIENVKILVDYEKCIKNNENKTAYNLALENEHKECVRFLEKIENISAGDSSEDSESGKNLRKDLEKLQKANKDMEKLVEQQKTKENVSSFKR